MPSANKKAVFAFRLRHTECAYYFADPVSRPIRTMFHPQGPTFWELATQSLSSTERGYDLLAPKFDLTPFRTPDDILIPVAEAVGPPESIDSALDVCCGTGSAMRMVRPLCRRRVVGLDFSRNMIEIGRERVADVGGQARVEFVRGNLLDMPFGPVFDLAVCFGALGHILPRDHKRFVEQVAQVLKPGGRFVFASSDMPPLLSRRYWLSRGFNAAMHVRNTLVRPPFIMFYLTFLLPGAARLLEESGFAVDVRRDVFPDPYSDACLVLATRK